MHNHNFPIGVVRLDSTTSASNSDYATGNNLEVPRTGELSSLSVESLAQRRGQFIELQYINHIFVCICV